MGQYVRTTTVDSGPTGDSTKQAVLDVDTDLTGIVAAYNTHDTATTSVHGFTGTKTGSGAMVGATSPTLVTPTIGVATATSINKVAITAPATSATITMTDGKTLSVTNTLTFSGTDSTVMTFPSTSATIARTDAANTFTGHQTIEGVTSTGATGTGKFVFDTSPTLVTPLLGTPTSGTLTNCTGLPVATGISGLGSNVATFLATPSSANLASAVTDETGSGALVFGTSPTLATPDINAGTVDSLTSLSIRDTSAAYDVTIAAVSSTTLTGGRTLTLDMVNAARSIKLAGNLDIAGNLSTSGAYAVTLTATNTTTVTLPTSGTLVSSVTTGNGVSATNTAGALAFTLGAITPTTVNGVTISGAGSLDVASGKTLNVDDDVTFTKGLTVTTNAGTLAFSAASKTLTVAESLTTPAVTGAGEIPYGSAANVLSSLAAGSDGQVLVSNGAAAPSWEYQPKQNLLTNALFIAASGSTLCEVTSGAAPVTDGADAALVNNLLVKGGFDDQASVDTWTEVSSTATSVGSGKTGNCMNVATAGYPGYAYKTASVTSGKLYYFSVYYKDGATNGFVRIGTTQGGAEYYGGTPSAADWTQATYLFEATATGTIYVSLGVQSVTAGHNVLFDNAVLYEVTPGYVAADALAPDGWGKSGGLYIYREHNGTNTKSGSFYGVKVVVPDAGGYGLWWGNGEDVGTVGYMSNLATVKRFQGRTVTLGAWVKTSTGSAIYLALDDDGAAGSISSIHSGGGDWEWLEVTRTFSATVTQVVVGALFIAAATVYISQPMLVFGSSIGEGNFQPVPGEVIWLQSLLPPATLHNKSGLSDTAWTTINLEADTSGAVGKGVKAILLEDAIRDSGSAAAIDIILAIRGLTPSVYRHSVNGLANDATSYHHGWISCDANGDIAYYIKAGGATQFDIIEAYIGAIQT